jgi:hypothetical protein
VLGQRVDDQAQGEHGEQRQQKRVGGQVVAHDHPREHQIGDRQHQRAHAQGAAETAEELAEIVGGFEVVEIVVVEGDDADGRDDSDSRRHAPGAHLMRWHQPERGEAHRHRREAVEPGKSLRS